MKLKFKAIGLLLAGIACIGLVACSSEEQAVTPQQAPEKEELSLATIEGEVFYRERIMIPAESEVEIQLEDISKADAMATVMESVSFKAGGGPPYAFSIEYDPARIDERMRYALRARITSPEGELLFTNTEYIDPFSGNPVKVMVHSIARKAPAPAPAPEPEPAPQPQHAEKPVSAPQAADDVAEGTIVWILATLEGEEAPAGVGGKSVDLHLNAADGTAAGFSGCNRYTGGFSSDGRSTHGTPIKFGPLAGTMMACPKGGEVEQAYLQTLGRVDSYRMEGGNLALLAGNDVVATFKPR